MNSLQLFLGRNVARALRNFPWPIRREVLDFPPITVRDGAQCLLVLGTPRRFLETLWTAYGWMRHLSEEVFLVVMVDGSITPDMEAAYRRCFIGGRLEEATAFLSDWTAGTSGFTEYIRHSPFGRKLGVQLKLNRDYPVLYSDNDVVVWSRPDEVIRWMREGGASVYNSSPDSPFTASVVEAFQRRGISVLNDLNGGILFLPKGQMDLGLAKEILNEVPPDHGYGFIDQTLAAGLCARGAVKALPGERYVISTEGMWFWRPDTTSYDHAVCRHFVGPVRHWMYLKGYPRLREAVRRDQAGSSSTSPR